MKFYHSCVNFSDLKCGASVSRKPSYECLCSSSWIVISLINFTKNSQLLAYLMNELVSTRLKQQSTKTNVSMMKEKQTHPLTFSGLKNRLIDLMQHLGKYTNTLPVFGFNSGQYVINLIKSYLIHYLINGKEIEPSVIKKANEFVSFKI